MVLTKRLNKLHQKKSSQQSNYKKFYRYFLPNPYFMKYLNKFISRYKKLKKISILRLKKRRFFLRRKQILFLKEKIKIDVRNKNYGFE
jgi:hypothetical protein